MFSANVFIVYPHFTAVVTIRGRQKPSSQKANPFSLFRMNEICFFFPVSVFALNRLKIESLF